MILPLIVTGHTAHEDKFTIIDTRGAYINVLENVDLCKKNNPNIEFYTIYSVDESISSPIYDAYFDKVLYSKDVPHSWTGEKIKVETALNFIKDMEWDYFVKTCSRTVLNNIEQYISIPDRFDYMGKNHQTPVQFDLSMFIGSRKLIDVWIDCEPHMDRALNITGHEEWMKYYNINLLENLFYNVCRKYNVRYSINPNLYQNWCSVR